MRTLVIVLVGVFAVSVDAQELTWDWIDVSSVVENAPDSRVAPWQLPIRGAYSGTRGESDGSREESGEGRSAIEGEALVEIIRASVAPESWDMEGRTLSLSAGHRLFVRNERPIVERVRAAVTELGAVVSAPIRIDVSLVRGPSPALMAFASESATVSRDAVAALGKGRAGGLAVVPLGSAVGVSGQRLRVRSGRRLQFCGDYDVEVAQTAQIPDPEVLRFLDGVDLVVRPQSMFDRRVHLRIQGALTTDASAKPFEDGGPSIGRLELPEASVQMVTSTAALRSGEGLLVGAIASGEQASALLITARFEGTSRDPFASGTASLFPVGHVVHPWLAVPRLELGFATTAASAHQDWDEEESAPFDESSGYMDSSRLEDALRTLVAPEDWGESPFYLHFGQRGWLVSLTDRARQKAIREVLGRLSADRAQYVRTEVVVLEMPRTLAASQRGEADWIRRLMALPGVRRHHTVLAMTELRGRIECAAGREFAYVADYDAEIAEGASISDPRVETGFSGLRVRLSPAPVGERSYAVHFEVERSALSEIREVEAGAVEHGMLQIPQLATTSGAGRVVLGNGQHALLAESTDPSGERTVLIVLKVTAAE